MTRTIERIVENHQAAAALRAAGKPVWSRRIDIKAILREDPSNDSDEHAASVANRIGALLRASVPCSWLDWNSTELDEDLCEIVEGMEALKPDSYADDEGYSPLEDLNSMLNQLYDWADTHRVWLG